MSRLEDSCTIRNFFSRGIKMLRLETILSILMIKGKDKNLYNIGFLSKLLEKLKRKGCNIPDFSLRSAPYGELYSEDVDDFISRLLLFGHAVRRNPIELTPTGLELLEEEIEEAKKNNPEEVKEIEDKLALL